MANVVFIDVNTNRYERFPNQVKCGPLLLGSMAHRAGHNVLVYGSATGVDWNAVYEADVVLLSSLTSSIPFAYQIAKRLRAMNKKFALGGTHATVATDEALGHFDYVAKGEGEPIVLPLIKALLKGEGFEEVPGLSWKQGTDLIHNPRALPPPLDQVRDYSIHRANLYSHHNKARYIMFSRGCTNNCTFCSIHTVFPGKPRYANKELILSEILGFKGDVNVMDDNIANNPEYTLDIVRRIRPLVANRKFSLQAPVTIAFDEPLMKELARFECPPSLVIGLESCNQETLNSFKKGLDLKTTIEALKILKGYGMIIQGMFVVGGDGDGPDCVRNTVDFALKHRIDYILMYSLTPFPGTQLTRQYLREGRILPISWSYYDSFSITFLPKHVRPDTLQREFRAGYNRFYMRPQHYLNHFYSFYKYPTFYMKTLFNQLRPLDVHRIQKEAGDRFYRGQELQNP